MTKAQRIRTITRITFNSFIHGTREDHWDEGTERKGRCVKSGVATHRLPHTKYASCQPILHNLRLVIDVDGYM